MSLSGDVDVTEKKIARQSLDHDADAPAKRATRSDDLDYQSKTVTLRTAGVQFWAAVVALLGAIVVGTTTILTRLGPIADQVGPKPLEGEWELSIVYDRFHTEAGTWSGDGRALFVWKREQGEYQFWHGADVFRQGERNPVLTTFSRGYVRADADGWPTPPFDVVDIRYIARKHVTDTPPTMKQFTYKNCTLTGDKSRPDVIQCDLDTGRSHAVVRIKRFTSLH